jgi:hypothetical protein
MRRRHLLLLGALLSVSGLLLLPATGEASLTPPNLVWSPTTGLASYDYGTLDAGAGATSNVTFTLKNKGGMSSGVLTATLTGSSAFAINHDGCTGVSLGPNRSCTVTVTYAPALSGQNDSATLSAAPKRGQARSLTLTGKSGTPNLVLAGLTPDATTADGTNLYTAFLAEGGLTPFTVENVGTGTASGQVGPGPGTGLHVGTLGGDGSIFISADTCTGQRLAPGGFCFFQATYITAFCPSSPFSQDYVGFQNSGAFYIQLNLFGICVPLP